MTSDTCDTAGGTKTAEKWRARRVNDTTSTSIRTRMTIPHPGCTFLSGVQKRYRRRHPSDDYTWSGCYGAKARVGRENERPTTSIEDDTTNRGYNAENSSHSRAGISVPGGPTARIKRSEIQHAHFAAVTAIT